MAVDDGWAGPFMVGLAYALHTALHCRATRSQGLEGNCVQLQLLDLEQV